MRRYSLIGRASSPICLKMLGEPLQIITDFSKLPHPLRHILITVRYLAATDRLAHPLQFTDRNRPVSLVDNHEIDIRCRRGKANWPSRRITGQLAHKCSYELILFFKRGGVEDIRPQKRTHQQDVLIGQTVQRKRCGQGDLEARLIERNKRMYMEVYRMLRRKTEIA